MGLSGTNDDAATVCNTSRPIRTLEDGGKQEIFTRDSTEGGGNRENVDGCTLSHPIRLSEDCQLPFASSHSPGGRTQERRNPSSGVVNHDSYPILASEDSYLTFTSSHGHGAGKDEGGSVGGVVAQHVSNPVLPSEDSNATFASSHDLTSGMLAGVYPNSAAVNHHSHPVLPSEDS